MKKILLTALIASSFASNAAVTKSSTNTPIGPFGAVTECGTATTEDIVTFTEMGTITDMDVTVDFTHTWRSDLTISAVYDGTTVVLASAQGGSADDYVATFDDEAVGACDGTIAGACTPENALSAFNGSTTPGDIQLTFCDGANGDSGTLNAWSVTLQGQPGDQLPVELMNLSID